MFSIRISTVVLAASALLAVAIPTTNTGTTPENSCSTGDMKCCTSTSKEGGGLLSGLGVVTGALGYLGDNKIVVDCSPLVQVVGVGGSSCSGQVACCTGNTFNSLISLDCSPVNVGL